MDRKLLGIYLNDHLAGSTLAYELAKRSAGSNRGTELEAFLERFMGEIAEDRTELMRLMEGLGIKPDPLELETLSVGVEGKLALWLALRGAGFGDEPAGIDLVRLTERAQDQRRKLERHRVAAAREAFATP